MDYANTRAIDYFLDRVWQSDNPNLDERAWERAEMRKQLEETIEADGNGLFKHAAEIEGGNDELEVSVDPGKVKGPRN